MLSRELSWAIIPHLQMFTAPLLCSLWSVFRHQHIKKTISHLQILPFPVTSQLPDLTGIYFATFIDRWFTTHDIIPVSPFCQKKKTANNGTISAFLKPLSPFSSATLSPFRSYNRMVIFRTVKMNSALLCT